MCSYRNLVKRVSCSVRWGDVTRCSFGWRLVMRRRFRPVALARGLRYSSVLMPELAGSDAKDSTE